MAITRVPQDGIIPTNHNSMPAVVVSRRDQYGTEVFYPISDSAKTFAALAGTKTLTARALVHIEALGFKLWES